MTDDQMFWESRRAVPAPPARPDRIVILEFEPSSPSQRASILAAADAWDAIGYQTTGSHMTVWVRLEAAVAVLRGLGAEDRPVRVSIPPSTTLWPGEIALIRKVAGIPVSRPDGSPIEPVDPATGGR